MTGWIILGSVLVLLVLLCQVRLGVEGSYTPEGGRFALRLGPLRFQLWPRKKPTKKPKQKTQKVKKAKPAKAKKPQKPGLFDNLTAGDIFVLVRDLAQLGIKAASRLRKKLRVDVLELEIIAAASDPDRAVSRYGRVNALVGTLWQPLNQAVHIRDGRIRVNVDFDRPHMALYGQAAITLTIGQSLALGLGLGFELLRYLMQWKQTKQKGGLTHGKAAPSQ